MCRVKDLLRGETGGQLLEFVLLAALVAAIGVPAVMNLGDATGVSFVEVEKPMASEGGECAEPPCGDPCDENPFLCM